MDPMPLSFETLIAYLNRAIGQIKDPRQRSNATQYPLRDVVLGAFQPSSCNASPFWSINGKCPVVAGAIMLKPYLGYMQVPTNAQVRNVLDKIPTAQFRGIFDWVYQALRRGGFLKPYQYLGGH